MKVNIMVSARHIHLSKEDLFNLFGEDYELTPIKYLNQEPNFSSNEKITIKYNDKVIENIRVVGPVRDETLLELSKTDCYNLGVEAELVNPFFNIEKKEVLLIGPNGSIKRKCLVIQNRHIHLNAKEATDLNLKQNDRVKIKIDGVKSGILDDVYVRVSDNYHMEVHLDLDDGNAFLIDKKSEGELIYD